MERGGELLKSFFAAEEKADIERNVVRWIEWSQTDLLLVRGSLDVSSLLSTHLFSKLKTTLLCSATLTVGPSFELLKERLGLTAMQHRVQELIVSSPFDYTERTLFTVPLDLPLPSSEEFFPAAVSLIKQMIAVSRGSVLILLTSYEMLKNLHQELVDIDHPLLYQGQMPRHQLLQRFRQQEGSVLLATDSFWEGVDVPGEALRCVIIVKLPFSVPSDPLYEACAQALQRAGKDPFVEHAIPQAVIKFKQGFGRLMRHHLDRGCVVCLDSRIIKKRYGRYFLESLPACPVYTGSSADVLTKMQRLYQKTDS
jgi:ATP-dependent DNA helicase DinG